MKMTHEQENSTPAALIPQGVLGGCLLLAILACVGCTKMSESVTDASVGMNGGFEHSVSGLPVNWLVYSPSTIPSGDYELHYDDADFKEGRQSLKFLIRECSATGGWHSPGLCQEFPALPGETYLISFWIKTDGCNYTVRVGGVDAWNGQYQAVASSSSPTTVDGSWKHVEQTFVMPPAYERLRFELSITSAGSLWIDDVRIDRSSENGGPRDDSSAE